MSAQKVGDICGGLESVKAVSFVGNDHAHETSRLEKTLAISEETDRVGEMLEVMAAYDPVETVYYTFAANYFKQAGGVSNDIDLFDERNPVLGHIHPSRLFTKLVRAQNINDESFKAIPLRGYRIAPGTDFDALGVLAHCFLQSV
jgi:hypothetical protein